MPAPPNLARTLRRATLALSLVAAVLAVPTGRADAAVATELFFSEYVEGSSNNKALEVFNGTDQAIDLVAGDYDVQMFFNGNPVAGSTIDLTGTVASGDVFVLAHASAAPTILGAADQTNGSGWFNGDDAVVLRRGGVVVDSIGQVGVDPGSEWGSGLTSTADNTLRRMASVTAGDLTRDDSFDPSAEWDGFATDTHDGLGAHSAGSTPEDRPVTATCPAPQIVLAGRPATFEVTGTDPDGAVTSFSTAVDPSTDAVSQQQVVPAGQPGGTARTTIAIGASAEPGRYEITVSATNDGTPSQSDDCTFTVTVQELLEIGDVQGAVTDEDDGATHASPHAGDTVHVRGVVAQRVLTKTASGSDKGFFLQDVDGDGDPRTSDGVYVYQGRFPDLIGGYVPEVGDEVVLRARVAEYFGLTELTSARLVGDVLAHEVAVEPVVVRPPDDLAASGRYWERIEGMQAQVPAGSAAVDGRDVFASTMDGEVWVVRGDHPVIERDDPYARRVFRDPHPLDDEPAEAFDDGNGYRILLGSLGLKASTGDVDELIAPVRTFDTVTNAPVGGVYYAFAKYSVQVADQLEVDRGVDPAGNAPPGAPAREVEYSVSTYNVENLYDFRDDPNDGCDFTGNGGCEGVRPPFDYVPASEAAYEERIAQIARQVTDDLHAPDVLLVQEAEDQDICAVDEDRLVCGATDDADGRPDTLQELALAIAAAGGPSYDAAYDRDGADDRGIVSAFLYRDDRVELLPARPADPVLGSDPTVDYAGDPLPYVTDVQNPKALNAELPAGLGTPTGTDGDDVFTRAPQVALFRIWRAGIGTSVFTDVYAISNHFSSGPDRRIEQRREQAAYDAAIGQALDDAGASRVLVGGDLNVYPRPDDALRPGDPHFGADQLGPLYDAGLHNLYDRMVEDVPEAAYSYVFQGQTQTLDQVFASETLLEEVVEARAAHVNADFPADFDGDGTRGLSDHDPQVVRLSAGVTIDQLEALVRHFVASGAVRSGKEMQLLEHLDRARRFAEDGNEDAAGAQVEAFADQAQDLSPRHVGSAAADVLAHEAALLLEHAPVVG